MHVEKINVYIVVYTWSGHAACVCKSSVCHQPVCVATLRLAHIMTMGFHFVL